MGAFSVLESGMSRDVVPPARTCTCDQRVTKAPLYYLSYGDELVFRMGLEPI
jgi:hypothetical protein